MTRDRCWTFASSLRRSSFSATARQAWPAVTPGTSALAACLIKDLEDLALPVTVAIPCGLMVNELLSNSLKYAFPDGRAGIIEVCFRRDGEQYVLRVADDGVGLPPDMDPLSTSSLGLKLVLTLVRQLKGELDILPPPGASFRIAFPCKQTKTAR